MSNPVWDDFLRLLETPNLEVIIPDIGLANVIPIFTFALDVVRDVFTVPDDVLEFFATVTTLTGSTYNFATKSSTPSKFFNFGFVFLYNR